MFEIDSETCLLVSYKFAICCNKKHLCFPVGNSRKTFLRSYCVSESPNGNAQAFGNFLNVLFFLHDQGHHIFCQVFNINLLLRFCLSHFPPVQSARTHTHTQRHSGLTPQVNYTALQTNQHPLHVFELNLQNTVSS